VEPEPFDVATEKLAAIEMQRSGVLAAIRNLESAARPLDATVSESRKAIESKTREMVRQAKDRTTAELTARRADILQTIAVAEGELLSELFAIEAKLMVLAHVTPNSRQLRVA
jgi:hypothetical protein